MSRSYGLGIDYGTINFCFSAGGEVLQLHNGFPTTRSVVCVAPDGSFTIPRPGQLPGPSTYQLTLCKRLIGRRSTDGTLRQDIRRIRHAVFDKHGSHYQAGEHRVAFVEAWAYTLGRARRVAQRKFGKAPRKTVLTVPAYYGSSQCEAIRSAADIAGFDMESTSLVYEPVAILVEHVEDASRYPDGSRVVVIDPGGGTTDITEVCLDTSGGRHSYHIEAIEGDNFLGGADCDKCLLTVAVKKAEEAGWGYELDMDKLLLACESAKEALTDASVTQIELFTNDPTVPSNLITVTREEFVEACKPLIERFSELIDRLPIFRDGQSLAAVLLAGGASQTPWVIDLCKSKFPNTAIVSVRDAATAVARGADRIATADDIIIHSVLSKSIRIASWDLDGRLTTEEVAQRNMRVPTRATHEFKTNEEDQSELEFEIFEGESVEKRHNTRLGTFNIVDIPKCPEGTVIRVDLTINGLGDFTVKATIQGLTGELVVVPRQFLNASTVDKYKRATACRLDGKAVDVSLIGEIPQDSTPSSEEDSDTDISDEESAVVKLTAVTAQAKGFSFGEGKAANIAPSTTHNGDNGQIEDKAGAAVESSAEDGQNSSSSDGEEEEDDADTSTTHRRGGRGRKASNVPKSPARQGPAQTNGTAVTNNPLRSQGSRKRTPLPGRNETRSKRRKS